MKKSFMLVYLALTPFFMYAQFTLSGKVTDVNSGNPLPGAHIVIENSYSFSITGENGFFNFSNLKSGNYQIKITFVGYDDFHQNVELKEDFLLEIHMKPKIVMEDEVVIMAARATAKSPATFTNISKEEIKEVNMGKDLPVLLEMTPGTVVTSDAGAGVGYTGIRIRGTDITRINVTVNGIPLNDPESQGVFWVNMPDFASSVDDVQIQRGVGASSNGAAAFGASINIKTQKLRPDPYAEINSTIGSYNTLRNTISFGTGLLDGKFTLDGRLSKITSDGYIERASSDLTSFFVSGGYFGERSMLKVNVFSGNEKTYQAWNGVPSDSLQTNRTYNPSGEYVDNNGHLKYYENETDNYQQDHLQVFYSNMINRNLNVNTAFFYVYGNGYYENYKQDQEFGDYGLQDVIIGGDTISETDLIRRKYLDNRFYGFTFSANYNNLRKLQATFGGSINYYDGQHFGNIIWAEYASNGDINLNWYDNTGIKKQFDLFGKMNYQVNKSLNAYADLQIRGINYKINGIHDDLQDITQHHEFTFFNPKFGILYDFDDHNQAYFSLAVANREPTRSDYRDADADHQPIPEKLLDYELGYTFKSGSFKLNSNLFFMDYKDQLVLTGEINNVGSPIFTNIPQSYRAGIEILTGWKITKQLSWETNASFSKNKIVDFTGYVDNWSEPYGQLSQDLGETDLSFSPEIIANSSFSLTPVKNLGIRFNSKYVGKQFIDNTSGDNRSLSAWFVNDLLVNYSFSTSFIPEIGFHFSVSNIFSEKYESNAWIYHYYYEGKEYFMDGYFPQAPVNFLGGVTLRF